jgi:hypothetical protein
MTRTRRRHGHTLCYYNFKLNSDCLQVQVGLLWDVGSSRPTRMYFATSCGFELPVCLNLEDLLHNNSTVTVTPQLALVHRYYFRFSCNFRRHTTGRYVINMEFPTTLSVLVRRVVRRWLPVSLSGGPTRATSHSFTAGCCAACVWVVLKWQLPRLTPAAASKQHGAETHILE